MSKRQRQPEPEQLYLDGTAPEPDPDLVPEVDALVRTWLDAKAATKDAAEAKAEGEHRLMVELAERGLERYPYTDPPTGKRRYFIADKTPKAKTIAAPDSAKPKRVRDDEEIAKRADTQADKVEVRRVSRASVAKEIGENPSDPFASTRLGLVEEAEARQAAIANGDTPTPLAEDPPARRKR